MEQHELLSMSSYGRWRRINNYFDQIIFNVIFHKTCCNYEGTSLRKAVLIPLLFLALAVSAKDRTISGKVIYIAAGSVYTSIGREAGVSDSLRMAVLRGKDTLAVLQEFALSSKTSACRIIDMRKQVSVGDSVEAVLQTPPTQEILPPVRHDTSASAAKEVKPPNSSPVQSPEKPPVMKINGRISIQYNALYSDYSPQDFQQSGVTLNLHSEASDAPVKFEMYGNLRNSARGSNGLFSGGSSNDSRIYRMSLEYDDRTNILSIGRILSPFSSYLGYIDGVSIARRWGNMTGGASIGYQPDSYLQMPSTENKKLTLFAQYQGTDSWKPRADIVYARVWSGIGIEQEAVSALFNMYSPGGLSLYANTEVEMHTSSQGNYSGPPALSLFYCSLNYMFSDFITAGIGIDASRPVFTRALTRLIPDSLLDNQLQSGISLNLNVSLWRGAGFFDTYTARSSNEEFGRDYSNSSGFFAADIEGTGVMMRLNYFLNKSELTRTQGYGAAVQRTIIGIDCGIRFQKYRSIYDQIDMANESTTIGFDLMAMLAPQLTLFGSFDRLQGPGSSSTSIFLELSERF
jgi:hypothetical protein